MTADGGVCRGLDLDSPCQDRSRLALGGCVHDGTEKSQDSRPYFSSAGSRITPVTSESQNIENDWHDYFSTVPRMTHYHSRCVREKPSYAKDASVWANFFCRGPDSKYFRLFMSYGLCHKYSVLPLKHESRHTQNINECACLCSPVLTPASGY